MADFDRPWDASDPSANAAVAVRAATAEDTAAIHGLHVSCFPDLFAGLLGDYLPPVKERVKRERSGPDRSAARSNATPCSSPSDRSA